MVHIYTIFPDSSPLPKTRRRRKQLASPQHHRTASQLLVIHARACALLTDTTPLDASAEDTANESSASAAAGSRCSCGTKAEVQATGTPQPTQAGELEGPDAAEDAGGQVCFVCMDVAADAILIECGHGGLCAGEAVFQTNRSYTKIMDSNHLSTRT
jgi:hypothetical protein